MVASGCLLLSAAALDRAVVVRLARRLLVAVALLGCLHDSSRRLVVSDIGGAL
jgi:hypothetical protein